MTRRRSTPRSSARRAYAEAGASGFFAPGLADLKLLARLCVGVAVAGQFHGLSRRTRRAPRSPRPASPGSATGPSRYMLAMKALKEAAEAIYRG